MDHVRSLLILVDIRERLENPQDESAQIVSEPAEQLQSTITRGELYLKETKMAQDVLQSLTVVLYNRINK